MSKPEWGTKRVCASCGTRFYDLRLSPPTCPKCRTVHTGKAAPRARRPLPAAKEAAVLVPKASAAGLIGAEFEVEGGDLPGTLEEEPEIEEIEDDGETADLVEEEDEELIEDASELGADDEDMSEVIDRLDGELEEPH